MPSEVRAYRVSGHVQGVGFRWWAARAARRLSLAGSVRNLEDGSVAVVAAGEPDALEVFERQLGSGPPGARVSDLRRDPPPAEPPAGEFAILR